MYMGREELIDVFRYLDAELEGYPHTEILIVGGAAIVFWWEDKRTWDVDVIAEGFPKYLQDAIEIVAERQALNLHWMNLAATGIRLPKLPDARQRLYKGENLEIFTPDQQYILAMKLHAHRLKDLPDAVFLAKSTEKTTVNHLATLFLQAYETKPNEAVYEFIDDIVKDQGGET